MIPYILGLLGLAMGSFIDALVYRLHAQEKLPKNASAKRRKALSMSKGRSMCEQCQHTLGVRDLIPVLSWLSTSGKCRYCGKPIGWQTPVIEVGMAALFVGLWYFWPGDLDTLQEQFKLVAWLVFSVALVAAAVYDLRWLILPNRIMLPMIAAAIGYRLVLALGFGGGAEQIKEAVLGLLVGGGIFYGLFAVSSGRWIGGGDVKLGFLIGILLGPLHGLIALWLAFAIALIVTGPLLILGRISRKQPVPFGPFLILATFIALLWGQQLADWYNELVFLV